MPANIRLVFVVLGMAIVGCVVMFSISKAHGHEWYDPWCCNDRDCGPIESKYIHETQEGWDIAPSEGGGFVARGKERQSPDGGYHICRYPGTEIRCFYVPAMGS